MAGKVDELASGVGMVLMTEHPAPDEVAAAGTRVGVGDETALGVEVTAACCEEHEAKSSKAENARSKKKEVFKCMRKFQLPKIWCRAKEHDSYLFLYHPERSKGSQNNIQQFVFEILRGTQVPLRIMPARNLLYCPTAFFNSSNEVIHAMRLTKSASDLLCARNARTAGPTGSAPAAPPGTSA